MPRSSPTPAATKEQARAWKARWRAVRELEIAEARSASPEKKLRELAGLFRTARAFGWDEPTAHDLEEDRQVRERWRKLYKAHGV